MIFSFNFLFIVLLSNKKFGKFLSFKVFDPICLFHQNSKLRSAAQVRHEKFIFISEIGKCLLQLFCYGFASEPDNATKVAKAKWSNLRVHFKVSFKFFDRELRFTRDPRKLFVVVVDCAIYSNCYVFHHLLALGKSRHVWAM